jgi:RimJ/RimL family protein N-acetyltransferase
MIYLRELDEALLPTAAAWLAQRDNARWLDFGHDVQELPPAALWLMARRPLHCIRVFCNDVAGRPLGIVALSNIARTSRTASLWYLLGDKRYAARGCTTEAVRHMLDHAFGPLGLQALHAWAVAENIASVRVLEKTGFRYIGRQRRCHPLDGRPVDRLLFDLLHEEHCCLPCRTTTLPG